MFKILIIIQLGSQSHSSQIVEFETASQAEAAVRTLNEAKVTSAYNLTIFRMY